MASVQPREPVLERRADGDMNMSFSKISLLPDGFPAFDLKPPGSFL